MKSTLVIYQIPRAGVPKVETHRIPYEYWCEYIVMGKDNSLV